MIKYNGKWNLFIIIKRVLTLEQTFPPKKVYIGSGSRVWTQTKTQNQNLIRI